VSAFAWNDDLVEELRLLADRGMSANEIAAAIGAPSRNSVIGKAFRLHIQLGEPKRPADAANPAAQKAAKPATPKPRPEAKAVEPAPEAAPAASPPEPPAAPRSAIVEEPAEEIGATLVKLFDLKSRHCKWPVGDPQHAAFGFCGARRLDGGPYCAGHAAIAYQPREQRRPARKSA
jgi:GcrA cell cycle regulator